MDHLEVHVSDSAGGHVSEIPEYLLGIDLGVLSLGWAAVKLQDGRPIGLLDAGVRAWDLQNIAESDIAVGKEEPPSQTRRQMRQMRRQLFRRAQRLRRTWRALQQLGLFPPGSRHCAARKAFLDQLDGQAKAWLCQHRFGSADPPPHWEDTWIYHLRAAALDQPLPPELLGRVFFHLAQRRGFQSTAKTRSAGDQKDGEDRKNKKNKKGKKSEKSERERIRAAISQLQQAMQTSGARTLGEYFARLDPHQERIRGRWTSRRMYKEEFEAIWTAQAPFHPEWTAADKDRLFRALFFQRPLKSQRGLVGLCPLESKVLPPAQPGQKAKVLYRHRRAPLASLEAQRLRYMQRINDLEIIAPDGTHWVLRDPAYQLMRSKLYDLAEHHEELTFPAIRKALGIPTGKKGQDWKFNLEAGGEKKLPGNTTAARIRRILGDQRWDSLGPDGQKQLVDTLLAFLSEEALQQHLEARWHLDPPTAQALAHLELEPGYHSYSRRAIRKLLPLLEQGLRLNEARRKLYPQKEADAGGWDRLPPVCQVLPQVRNPLLVRALTELRKVVNALLHKYGKPVQIRIELARDIKRSRREREALSRRMRKQEDSRKKAAQIAREHLGREPSPFEITKVLLAEECNWECPYTGRKKIELAALLGPEPQFDVEHIWPFDRSLDDSFANKTLCYHEENRLRKSNRTPWEAYGSDPHRWGEIIARVKGFQGEWAKEKLRRFLATELPEDFPQRHLSDTRWISRTAADYLGLLYGGRIDPTGKQRIQTTAGRLTALLRRAWDLDSILGPGTEKNRADHRQHAIDAVVIALTDPAVVHRLSRWASHRPSWVRITPQLDSPWPGFFDQVKHRILSILVSFRQHRRLSGPLHDQTFYAPPVPSPEDPKKLRTKVRKKLSELSDNAVEDIVDPEVRRLVQEKLQALSQHDPKLADPKKAFASPENLPYLRSRRTGQIIPIKSVRIWVTAHLEKIGSGMRQRYVIPGTNHHLEIFAHLDAQGNETRWDGHVVSLLEAVRRKRLGQPVVCRDHGPNTRFKFTLAKGDYIQWTDDQGQPQILRVIGISHNNIEFRLPSDARPITIIKQEKQRIRARYQTLFQRRARKVAVSPLGEVYPAGD